MTESSEPGKVTGQSDNRISLEAIPNIRKQTSHNTTKIFGQKSCLRWPSTTRLTSNHVREPQPPAQQLDEVEEIDCQFAQTGTRGSNGIGSQRKQFCLQQHAHC